MQILLYGAPLVPEADQQAFAYPAQIILQLAPFWWIDDVRVATAVWQGMSVILLIASLIVLLTSLEDVPRWLVAPAFLWQYTLLMLFQGQFTVLLFAALAFGFALYARQRDVLAGIVFALGMVKPELMLFPAVAFALHALLTRRYGFLFVLAGCGLALLGVTIAMFGWWIPRWLAEVSAYQGFAQSAYAWQTAWEINPALGVVLLVFMAFGISALVRSLRLLLAGSVPLGMLLLPQTLLWGLMLLVIPLLASWRGSARIGVILVWLAGWATLFLVQRNANSWRAESLVLCVLALAVVVWVRQVRERTLVSSAVNVGQVVP